MSDNNMPGQVNSSETASRQQKMLQKLLQKPISELTHPSVYNKLFNESNKPAPNLNSRKRKESDIVDPPLIDHSNENDVTDEEKTSNDWKVANNSKRHRKVETVSQKQIHTSNAFQVLSDNDNENQNMVTDQQTSTSEQTQTSSQKQHKKTTMPAIHTVNTNFKNIRSLILAKNNKIFFRLKQIDEISISIYTNNINDYETIMDLLKEKKIEHYTYTPKHLKPKSLLLLGIKGNFDASEVQEEIQNMKIPEVTLTKVSKYYFDKKNPNRYHFLVQLTPESKASELTNKKLLLNQKIEWDTIRKKSVFQCKNCQRIGHASSNCYLGYRCVKCSENHGPKNCPMSTQDSQTKLKCANCGSNDHPASYKGCPYLKYHRQLMTAVKNNTSNQYTSPRNFSSNHVRNGATYAQATRPVKNNSNFPPIDQQPRNQNIHDQQFRYTPSARNINQPQNQDNLLDILNKFKQDIIDTFYREMDNIKHQIAINTSNITALSESVGILWS